MPHVLGRVYELESGDPIEGALLRIKLGNPTLIFGREFAKSDEFGRFSLTVPRAGSYSMFIYSDGHVDRMVRGVVVRSNAPASLDVALTSGLSLFGRVFDLETGEPIRGGFIGTGDACSQPRARIDSNGHFTLRGLQTPRGGYRVWSPGWSSVETRAGFQFGPGGHQTQGAIVKVPRAKTIRGLVLDPDGRPARGAAVAFSTGSVAGAVERIDAGNLRASGSTVVTTTDADGQFSFPPPVRPHGPQSGQLLVRHIGCAPLWVDASAGAVLELVLDRGARLVATVVNADGSPAARASATLLRRGTLSGSQVMLGGAGEIVCDELGAAEFSNVSTGPWLVRVRSFDGSAEGEIELEMDSSKSRAVRIDLEPIDRVFGLVLDSRGRAVPDAFVMLGPDPLTAVQTDPDGRFLFRLESETPRTITVCELGGEELVLPIRRNEEMRVSLGPREFLRPMLLSLVDESSREPVRSGSVRVIFDRFEGGRHQDVLFSAGVAWLSIAQSGKSSIRCSAFGYETLKINVDAIEQVGGRATVRMRRARHLPKTGVHAVRLHIEGVTKADWIGLYDAQSGKRQFSPRMIGEGRFEFYWPAGVAGVVLVSGVEGYGGPVRFTLSSEDQHPTIEVPIRVDGGEIRGEVPSSASVYLWYPSGLERRIAVNSGGDSGGEFRTGKLKPGRYAVKLGGGGWRTVHVRAHGITSLGALSLR